MSLAKKEAVDSVRAFGVKALELIDALLTRCDEPSEPSLPSSSTLATSPSNAASVDPVEHMHALVEIDRALHRSLAKRTSNLHFSLRLHPLLN